MHSHLLISLFERKPVDSNLNPNKRDIITLKDIILQRRMLLRLELEKSDLFVYYLFELNPIPDDIVLPQFRCIMLIDCLHHMLDGILLRPPLELQMQHFLLLTDHNTANFTFFALGLRTSLQAFNNLFHVDSA